MITNGMNVEKERYQNPRLVKKMQIFLRQDEILRYFYVICVTVGLFSGAEAHSGSVPAGGRPERERTMFTTGRGASVPA